MLFSIFNLIPALTMETFITQLETLDIPEDDACRTRLKNAISSLQVRLEDPIETLVKYFSQVNDVLFL